MMKWGITCFFENRADFKIVSEIAGNYPIEYLEIRGERPFFSPEDLKPEGLEFIKQIIASSGLKTTLHSTFYDINLATINSYLRQANLDCYKRYLDLAAEIDAEIMVVHAGYLHRDAANLTPLWEMANENLVESLRQLGDHAASLGIKIGLENSPPNRNRLMIADWKRHIEVLKRTDHPAVGALWDMAHAFLHNLDLDEYYRNIKDYLVEIHAHNNMGEADEHRGMDSGKIPYAGFFNRHNIQVPVIMEIRNFEEAVESMKWIREIKAR